MSGFARAPIFFCYGHSNPTNTLRIPLAGGRVGLGIRMLPRTLEEAIDAFDFKRREWLSYINHVSDWEIDRCLKIS